MPGLGTERGEKIRGRLPPEARLILACARPQAGPDSEDEVRQLLGQRLDWPLLHRIAFRNGQIPRLWLRLSRIAPEVAPADSLQSFRAYYEKQCEQNRFLLETLLRLREQLGRKGIAVMPYVETHFSFFVPGQPGSRCCTWLDFLIRPEDVAAARKCISESGAWNELLAGEGSAAALLRRGNLVWGGGERESALSLHWATAPWVHAVGLDAQQTWQRCTTALLDGQPVSVLGPEDALLHVCAQNTENMWLTLSAVTDVADLVAAHPGLDWDTTIARARSAGVMRSLLLGLSLAEELLDSRLPEAAAAAREEDPELAAMVCDVTAELTASLPTRIRTPQTLRFHLRARERARDRVRYLARFLVTPTVADWKLLQLPRALHFLYSLLRPLRLVGATLRRPLERPVRALLRRPSSFSGYSPSARGVVDRMLELGKVGKDDVLYDVGCGDGRIVIRAAQRFGTRGVGIDLDPDRIRECRENARRAGVEHLVSFQQRDGMAVDLATATVVTMYLPAQACLQVTARLLRELRPGARIISHNCDMGGWDDVAVCQEEGFPTLLYLRRVPERRAAARGTSAD